MAAELPTWNFYPRSPCGERPVIFCKLLYSFVISIHALLAESDLSHFSTRRGLLAFLSTLSLRRATNVGTNSAGLNVISIHALLAESDGIPSGGTGGVDAFLSTLSLRRATTWQRGSRITYVEFLSTLSLRRATTT